MTTKKVREIMTKDVIAVAPKTTIREAAQLMVDHGISGLPVVNDDGRMVGIVTEGDLILRQKPERKVPWWDLSLGPGEELAREYQKAHGTTVAEVMTRAVLSIGPDLPIESAADLLDGHRIRRLPVIEDGRLVGIVSRGDLIKTLAAAPAREGGHLPDLRLVEEMKERLAREPWVSRGIVVHASDGIVSLWGLIETEAEKAALETMARSIEGSRGVENHLVVRSEIPQSYV
jgi:CBS domain-containing protein